MLMISILLVYSCEEYSAENYRIPWFKTEVLGFRKSLRDGIDYQQHRKILFLKKSDKSRNLEIPTIHWYSGHRISNGRQFELGLKV